jgi:hypothetical protein
MSISLIFPPFFIQHAQDWLVFPWKMRQYDSASALAGATGNHIFFDVIGHLAEKLIFVHRFWVYCFMRQTNL